MRDRWARRFPRLARVARQAFNVLAWAAVPLIVLNLLLIPESRQALPVYLGVFTMAVQMGLLLRSRGVSLAAYFSMVVASALFAPVINLVQQFVMAAFDWSVHTGESSVFLAGPSEETLKLVPLLAVLVFARNRAARFGIADHILLGTACGVGFGLTENVARALADSTSRDLLDVFTTMEDGVGHLYSLFTLFPGWNEAWGIQGAGHAVWTGLVAGGIGIARRYGTVLFSPLVLLLLSWATFDHMAFNHEATLGAQGLLPDQAVTLYELVGGGRATRPAFLLMVLLAVWLDYRTLEKVTARLPPFPARKGAPGSPSSPIATLKAELGLQWRVLRTDRTHVPQAMAFVRSRRELGYGLHRAAGGPRRDAPPGPLLWETGGRLHNLIAAGALLLFAGLATLMLTGTGGADTPAFLAPRLEQLSQWWDNLNPAQQLLVTAGGTAALMLIPGLGFWAALGWATTATSLAASGNTLADLVRNPRRLISQYTPGEILAAGIIFIAGRRVPLARGPGDIHAPWKRGRPPVHTPEGKEFRWNEFLEKKRKRGSYPRSQREMDRMRKDFERRYDNWINTERGNQYGDSWWRAKGLSGGDGWLREHSVGTPHGARDIDIANPAGLEAYEMKDAYVSLNRKYRLQMKKDAELVRLGWDVTWVCRQPPSQAAQDYMLRNGIKWVLH